MVPFLSTLAHLHASGIIHRDIKPENILVTDSGSLQLADFGLSIRSTNDAPVTRVGTLDYMAPEVVRCPRKRTPQEWKDRKDLHYTFAVDVWALGVLVYELCLGEPPFSGVRRFILYLRAGCRPYCKCDICIVTQNTKFSLVELPAVATRKYPNMHCGAER